MYRDKETGSHIRRVGMMSAALSSWPIVRDYLRPTKNRCVLAAPMHDIGKNRHPRFRTAQTWSANGAEHAIMQRQRYWVQSILGGSDVPLLQLAAEIALSHHERWDGTGYPYRKSGNQIPFLPELFRSSMFTMQLPMTESIEMAFAPDRVFENA